MSSRIRNRLVYPLQNLSVLVITIVLDVLFDNIVNVMGTCNNTDIV